MEIKIFLLLVLGCTFSQFLAMEFDFLEDNDRKVAFNWLLSFKAELLEDLQDTSQLINKDNDVLPRIEKEWQHSSPQEQVITKIRRHSSKKTYLASLLALWLLAESIYIYKYITPTQLEHAKLFREKAKLIVCSSFTCSWFKKFFNQYYT